MRKTLEMLALALCLAVLFVFGVAANSKSEASEAELIEIGKKIYRDGLLVSGQPVQAYVSGDIPVDGNQFTCVSCHNRSGMGASEGLLVAPMINKEALYSPATGGQKRRPAYTDATLAVAMRDAVDPAGQPIETPMPRYDLPELETKAIVAYMKSLSAEASPGVTAEEIHFATVVAPGVKADPMLALMRQFFEEKNAGTRYETRRASDGPWFRDNRNEAYRKWVLHVWQLEGAQQSWEKQLEAYYNETPVFALVAGLGEAGWQPVHDFCERHEIPAILPNVDLPVISSDDYYTLYFSQGMVLEARTIAQHVATHSTDESVLQVYRENAFGQAASAGLSRALARQDQSAAISFAIRPDQPIDAEQLASKIASVEPSVVVLWLGADDLEAVSGMLDQTELAARIYLSSTLLDADTAAIPDRLKRVGYLAHPFSLPDDFERRFDRIQGWLEHRGVAIEGERTLAQTYFACMVVGEALMHVRYDYFYRDYFLELIDHFYSIMQLSSAHSTPSFGPGQRYISKGCYVVDLARATDQAPFARAEWIVPAL
jgi:ABC-type branched-subunit amino acid transport system substrate-binding protein/mono/diheme cytochrome c family protein